ncbi:response regulator transcription factor [Clostridioides difficile]
MCKVMIVDDERLILEGVCNILEWDELGVEIVHLAKNGQDALDKFNDKAVDIVITDISMPKLNGIELIKAIKKINEKTKFIILSGYDDFKFAKQAISLGIENYILKPINEEELESTIKNTIEKIECEFINSILEERDMEVVKNNIYNRVLSDEIDYDELEERSFLLNLSLQKCYYQTVIVRLSEEENTKDKYRVIVDYLKEIFTFGQGDIFVNTKGEILILKAWEYEINEEIMIEYYRELLVNMKDKIGLDIFLSLGKIVKGYSNLKESYKVASKIKKYLLIKGYNNIITEEMCESEELKAENINIDLSNLRKLIIERNVSEVNLTINNFFEDIRKECNYTPEQLYDISISIIMTIKNIGEEFNVWENNEEINIRETLIKVCNEDTIDGIEKLIVSVSNKMLERLSMNICQYSPVVQQVMRYVEENYAEEMSLKTLSHKFNMNTSYLGQIFTKEVGTSFSDYLNKTKNERAKYLLLNTNMRIMEIAKEVGYTDTSYFYRKFKKYFGVCPADLREAKKY